MTDAQKPLLLDVLSHLITAKNAMCAGNIEELNKHDKIARELFKEYFPERPQEEVTELFGCCRNLYSQIAHTSYMGTFTGSREMWGHLLKQE